MTRCLPTVALAVLAVSATLSTGHPAAAGEESDKIDVFAARLFAGPVDKQKKTYGCFVRRYDAAHLARHPLQKVSMMKLLVTAEMLPEAESLNFSFRVGVRFRHRPGDFDSSGECGHGRVSESADAKEQLGCSVDCDGGGITIELSPDNKSTLIRLDSIRIWRNNKPDDEGFPLSGGADDRVFRVHRVGLEDCRSLVTDRQELAAMIAYPSTHDVRSREA
jgi:hypothetical protein